ncbi:hypothetical protein V8F20_004166 [Naviculisporaceae sp. PSN 640]
MTRLLSLETSSTISCHYVGPNRAYSSFRLGSVFLLSWFVTRLQCHLGLEYHCSNYLGNRERCIGLLDVLFQCNFNKANNVLGRQYHDFGNEVRQLHTGLIALTKVFTDTTDSLAARGLDPPVDVSFAWDKTSFMEIVGDFEQTLTECVRLLEDNRSYSSTTGPVDNITWNVFVQPNVDRLQRRLQFHNTKLALVLKPFEFDVRLRIHRDLQNRLDLIHGDIRRVWEALMAVREEIHALRETLDPSLAMEDQQRPGHDHYTLGIPSAVEHELTKMYGKQPNPQLPDLADAFVRVFNLSTRTFQPHGNNVSPSQHEYLALMASQFLMDKILASTECRELFEQPQHQHSHWKTYINFLRRGLLEECRRFLSEMERPIITDPSLVPEIWPPDDAPQETVESVRLPVMMEYLLESVLLGATADSWRKLKLLRYCDGTDRRFRLVLTGGRLRAAQSEARTIDFDIARSILIPMYASPDYSANGCPLEMVLKTNNEMHSLKFASRAELYKFQQAVTGYEVVDQHMEYNLKTVFVSTSNSREIEDATMQLWRPCQVEGEIVMADPDALQPFDDSVHRRTSRGSVQTSSGSTSSYSSQDAQQPQFTTRNYRPETQVMNDRRGLRTVPAIEPLFNPWEGVDDPDQQPPRPGSYSSHDHRQDGTRVAERYLPRTSTNSSAPPERHSVVGVVDYSLASPAVQSRGRTSEPAMTFNSGMASIQRPSNVVPNVNDPSLRMSALRGRQGIDDRPRPFAVDEYSQQRNEIQIARSRTGAETLQSFATRSVFTARDVSIAGSINLRGTGTLHCMPTDPLMVLFTKGSRGLSIVAVPVDDDIMANYGVCHCLTGVGPDGNGCKISALERSGSSRPLDLLRLGEGADMGSPRVGESQLDILPLAEKRRGERSARQRRSSRRWSTIIRISILHQSVLNRFHFSGRPCGCPPPRACTEGELMQCLAAGHRGRVGLLKEWYRRELVEWNRCRYHGTSNVIQT